MPVKPRDLPVTVVSDGCLIPENLKRSGKDQQWVEKVLAERSATLRQTLLLTVDREDHIYFLGKGQQA